MKTNIFCLPLLGALLALTACNTVYTSHMQALGTPKYPPTDPAQIQILHTEPTKPHIRLGEVRAEPARLSVDAAKIEEALRKAAAKLGADAVVIVYDKMQVVGGVMTGPWYGRNIQSIQGRVVLGVAIKYQ